MVQLPQSISAQQQLTVQYFLLQSQSYNGGEVQSALTADV